MDNTFGRGQEMLEERRWVTLAYGSRGEETGIHFPGYFGGQIPGLDDGWNTGDGKEDAKGDF